MGGKKARQQLSSISLALVIQPENVEFSITRQPYGWLGVIIVLLYIASFSKCSAFPSERETVNQMITFLSRQVPFRTVPLCLNEPVTISKMQNGNLVPKSRVLI